MPASFRRPRRARPPPCAGRSTTGPSPWRRASAKDVRLLIGEAGLLERLYEASGSAGLDEQRKAAQGAPERFA